MLASPEDMFCSAQLNSSHGTMHCVAARKAMCFQTRKSLGRPIRLTADTRTSASAPKTKRHRTTCVKDRPSSPIFMKRKLAPHTTAAAVY